MKTYRVAILGCRDRGGHAGRAYRAHPRTEVVGLCDTVVERLNGLGDELGVSARYTDLDAMIEEVRPDVVAIPTGTEFHYPLCMRVLEHGVDIDVEKPVTIDLEQVDTLVARAKEVGSRIAVHHQQRFTARCRTTRCTQQVRARLRGLPRDDAWRAGGPDFEISLSTPCARSGSSTG